MDIVFVTYNSEKWIDKCFSSILNGLYKTQNVNIIVVDNHSEDNTLSALVSIKEKTLQKWESFQIIANDKNLGFGKANNIGFKAGNSDIVCFINIDTEFFPDTLTELDHELQHSDKQTALWEFRQFPYEHPKLYDILTGYTSWCSGAAFAVRRKVFEKVHGFDEKIFLYAEDVDLSWRIRSEGFFLKYVPKIRITHYSYTEASEIKPNQYVFGIINNLLLRYRFGSLKTILAGHICFWYLLCKPPVFPGAKRKLLKEYWKHFGLIPHFHAKGIYKKAATSISSFLKRDYSQNREGAFYQNFLPTENPLVSVIVRTCGRPNVLREALLSLRNQTYGNIEIVIVEDGPPIAQFMIGSEFPELNILYHATGEKVGRSKAGNIAMSLAHGKYLNFLDDDDLFFADHIEVLVANLVKSGKAAAYSIGFETPITIQSLEPYQYQVMDYRSVYKQSFDKFILCHHNYIPIQCIMFEKNLFEKYGGLDEATDALEDWDMWVRYSLHTDFEFILKTTSIYRVPANKEISAERQKKLDAALIYMREKHKSYFQRFSVYDIAQKQ